MYSQFHWKSHVIYMGQEEIQIPFLTMASIIICVLTTTWKEISSHTREKHFPVNCKQETLLLSQDLQFCISEKSWMLSLPTKSEEDFSVTDGIFSLIRIYRCVWLAESDLFNHLNFRYWREHSRGTKWRKSNERVGPFVTHKHSCRKREALPAAISYHIDRK